MRCPLKPRMYHYYIYFRIPSERASDIEVAIQRIQFAVKAQLGVSGRLLKKRNEPNLWMEVYENLPEKSGFEDALRLAEDQTGIAALLEVGEKRHIECFEN